MSVNKCDTLSSSVFLYFLMLICIFQHQLFPPIHHDFLINHQGTYLIWLSITSCTYNVCVLEKETAGLISSCEELSIIRIMKMISKWSIFHILHYCMRQYSIILFPFIMSKTYYIRSRYPFVRLISSLVFIFKNDIETPQALILEQYICIYCLHSYSLHYK